MKALEGGTKMSDRDGRKPEFNMWNGSDDSREEKEGIIYSAWNGTKKALGMASDE